MRRLRSHAYYLFIKKCALTNLVESNTTNFEFFKNSYRRIAAAKRKGFYIIESSGQPWDSVASELKLIDDEGYKSEDDVGVGVSQVARAKRGYDGDGEDG